LLRDRRTGDLVGQMAQSPLDLSGVQNYLHSDFLDT
jgi:hypothetical protein